MKKRLVNLIAAIVMIFCGLFALSSCDNKTETGGGNEEVRQGLEYKTLNVDGTNVYGKVSNATETFSFLEEITANGTSKYIVALDIYGAKQVATKTIPLSVGDNIAYIMETIDGETVKMYTVTVRRRPIYTVSFNSAGGTEVQPQRVEEDSFATEPAAQSKAGYTFEKWNYDFSKPITQNTSVGAVWKAHTDTPYKVQYYWVNANDNGYTLHETVDLQGETDTTATAQIKSYEHFSHKSTATDSGNINGNGSLVLKVYYTREMLTVTFNGYGNETETKKVKYGGTVTAPEFTRTGYTQNGWNMPLPETISENITFTAAWKVNQYTLTFVFGNGQENKTITQDYGSAIEVETPEREGYDFKEWRESDNSWASVVTIPETMPAKNLTVYAWWKINQYSITLVYNNGQNNKTITQDYGSAIKVGAPEREGYTFIGWDSELPDVMPAKNLTFTAEWQINQYTLTLVLGGVLENKTITQDYGSVIEVETPEREGYDFKEWRESDNSWANVVTIPETMPAENLTIYANWNAIFTLSESGDTITGLTDYGKNATKLVIPEAIDDVKIVDIDSTAFRNYNTATCNEKDNLKYIGSKNNPYLFLVKASQNLENFEIDSGCKYIGDQAFYECSSLTSIEIPNGVTSIGKEAFYKCSRLTSIEIQNGVTFIGEAAFRECSGLTSITIPNSVTSIGKSAFEMCSKLTYNVKENLKYLGNSENLYLYLAGTTSTSITEAKIDNNCRFIGYSAVSWCSVLANITIPDSVTSIDNGAFFNCSGLTSVTIGNSVTSIGGAAFGYCGGLTSVTIGNSVTSIGGSAFYGCSRLTIITIGNSVTTIGNSAFSGCTRMSKVYYRGAAEEWNKLAIGSDNDKLASATRYYYSETKPEVEGNFWHYNDKHEIEEW